MCGRDGRRGGNSSVIDVLGDDPTDDEPAMGGGDVVYDASGWNCPEDGGVGSVGRSMFIALSIERFTLTFFSNAFPSRLSSRDVVVSSSGAGGFSASRSRRSLSLSSVHLLNRSATRVQPFWRASIAGVVPCLSARLGCAP